MPRLLDNWLDTYLQFTAEQESPENFHLWTGLGVISAAVRRQLSLDMIYGTIYPNLYIIMVAESAEVRKSTAANFGRKILVEAVPGINIQQDSMTSQALTKSLNTKHRAIINNKIVDEQRSSVTIFADEVANLFTYERTRAASMTIFLTTTYDCPDVYEHNTVRDSKLRLFNLYPVLIGCTDPKNIRSIPDQAADGLIGRLIWPIGTEKKTVNSGWIIDPAKAAQLRLLREQLVHDLAWISGMHGKLTADEKAIEVYDNWYHKLSEKSDIDRAAAPFYNRCHATVLRVSILLSIATSDSLVISATNMAGAIALIEQQLPSALRVGMWKGSTIYEHNRAKYLDFLRNAPRGATTRQRLLNHMGIQHDEFDRLTATLVQDGSIHLPKLKIEGQQVIQLASERINGANDGTAGQS